MECRSVYVRRLDRVWNKETEGEMHLDPSGTVRTSDARALGRSGGLRKLCLTT